MHSAWGDELATAALAYQGYGSPVDGDCVTLRFKANGLQDTRFFSGGAWLGIDDYIAPASNLCAGCGGAGIRHVPFIVGPITCPDCSGSGRPGVEAKAAQALPGIGDEIKPELKSKKLREW